MTASSESGSSITRAVMHALLKTRLVEEVLQDLNGLLADHMAKQDADVVAHVFSELQLPFDQRVASQCDINQCFYVHTGM